MIKNKAFQQVYDGGFGQWLWVARATPTCYIFVEILDLVDCCGRDATAQWCADVSSVDLADVSRDDLLSAFRFCGWVDMDEAPDPIAAIAECLWQYGCKAPLWSREANPLPDDHAWSDGFEYEDEDGEGFRALLAEAMEAAEEMLDEDAREATLDSRIVNLLGQTAREYSRGTSGLWDTLRTIKDDPNATPEQQLILKSYSGTKRTLGAGPVPPDLWTADE